MATELETWIDKIRRLGLEDEGWFYGVYRAEVTSVKDPQKRGRVQVKVPRTGIAEPLTGKNSWVLPAMMGAAGNRGFFWPPERGDTVFVFFDMGRPERFALYLPGFYGFPDAKTEVPEEFAYDATGIPRKRGFISRLGHSFLFDDTPGAESVRMTWHKPDDASERKAPTQNSLGGALVDDRASANRKKGKTSYLEFSKDGSFEVDIDGGLVKVRFDATAGSIELADGNKNTLIMNKNGVRVETKEFVVKSQNVHFDVSGDVIVGSKAKAGAVVKAKEEQAWLAAHKHPFIGVPAGAPGITTPTLPSPPPNAATSKFKTE